MIFRLLYEGRLTSNGSRTEKHAIRRQLHPQLAEVWQEMHFSLLEPPDAAVSIVPPNEFERGGFTFVPVVTTRLNLICHLDILFLRSGQPGSLITHSGDIDNRLKTLFDALQIPDEKQVEKERPADGETPFFCLTEDDALITKVTVDTDRLLKPDADAVGPTRVSLVIGVTLKATQLTWNNISLVS